MVRRGAVPSCGRRANTGWPPFSASTRLLAPSNRVVSTFACMALKPSFRASPVNIRDSGRTYNSARSPLRSEEHTSELQSRPHLVCRLLLEKKKKTKQERLSYH